MSTTARDKAWDDRVRKAAREMYPHAKVRDRYDADLLMAGFEDGADWGRASVLSALTEERIAETLAKAEDADYWVDEIADWEDGEVWEREAHPDNYPSSAYEDRDYYLSVTRAVLALIEQETGEQI